MSSGFRVGSLSVDVFDIVHRLWAWLRKKTENPRVAVAFEGRKEQRKGGEC